VLAALKSRDELSKRIDLWGDDEIMIFVDALRRGSKPMVIAANKMDIPIAEENLKRLKDEFKGYTIIGCAAEAELALRLASKKGLISYMPGDGKFAINQGALLTDKQRDGLKKIEAILNSFGSTGVQDAIDAVYKKELRMIPVFPVEDANKFTDHKGNVLPDTLLVQEGTTARGLAYKIHTDLGDGFLYAIDAKTGQKIGEDYQLKERDVIKIVSAKGLRG